MTVQSFIEKSSYGIFETMNSRDFSKVEPYMADNMEFDFPGAGLVSGKRRVIIFLNALLRKYPELTFSVSEILIDTERACVVWTNKGKNIDGNPYENRGMTFIRFENKKIIFLSDYFKDTSFVAGS